MASQIYDPGPDMAEAEALIRLIEPEIRIISLLPRWLPLVKNMMISSLKIYPFSLPIRWDY